MDEDYIFLTGNTQRDYAGTGQVSKECANSRAGDPGWIVKISHDYEIIDTLCLGDMGFSDGIGFMFKIGDKDEYYVAGVGHPDICGDFYF